MAFTSDKDDKQLFSRIDDAIYLSQKRHNPCFFGFLNEREHFLAKNYLNGLAFHDYRFFGGYEESMRQVLCVCDFPCDDSEFPIECVYFKFRKSDVLTHRDVLGSLMGLGIERSSVGDILIGDDCAAVYIKSEIADYVKSQIFKIGRVGVSVAEKKACNIEFKQDTEILSLTASSMRLDVIVAAITGLSREKTAALIISGKAFTNYSENKNVSCLLKQGDILTVRGYGKYVVGEMTGTTKKGRIKINIVHYR